MVALLSMSALLEVKDEEFGFEVDAYEDDVVSGEVDRCVGDDVCTIVSVKWCMPVVTMDI